jgi:hypothetical protein
MGVGHIVVFVFGKEMEGSADVNIFEDIKK